MSRSSVTMAFIAMALSSLLGATSRAEAQAPLSASARLIEGCLRAAADVYRVPPAVLVVLLRVEGGSLGHVSPNTNDTVDIGPMQVNQIWVPQVATHWHATPAATFLALRDSFCANVEAGAWILRQGIDEAHGDFWEGVGYYHSHAPRYKATYLHSVLREVLRLRAEAETSAAPPPPAAHGPAPAQIAALQLGAR